MDLKIKGKNAFITGGTRGLGLASLKSLASEGVNIAFCSRSEDGVNETTKHLSKLGVKYYGFVHEINSNDKNINELVAKLNNNFGDIDILVNNVGGSLGSSSLLDNDIETYMNVFNINFWASVKLMKIYSEKMVTNGWGRIINIASIFGREYGGKSSSYMSSKASLIAATKHLSIELADKGVTVNSIAPGSIKHKGGSWEKFVNNSSSQEVSDFINQNLPMKDFGSPEPVGDMVSFLSSPRSFTITGACINIDGGQSSNLF
ncbi:MAG: SDR family oxidoreductase [Chloroflexota bacterium]|nr:SDR family oxidoreductase [Chloroflexota bacterium]